MEDTKMKNKKIKLSIILTLMMIVSSFTLGTVNADPEENLPITKQVWDDCIGGWVDYLQANLYDTVRFKITIDYDIVNETSGYQAEDLVVKDILPPCLDYSNDVLITFGEETYTGESYIDGKTIYWNLSDDPYGIILSEEQGRVDIVTIEYNATVVDCGENINYVEVTGLEHCSTEGLYGDATATVYVECPCDPEIEVIKKVYNETSQEWEDYLGDLNLGDLVKFKIEVIFIEDCDTGYEILNLIIEDQLPCCLEFYDTIDVYSTGEMDEPTEEVSADGKVVFWNWTFDRHVVLHEGDSLTVEFRANFSNYCEFEDENCAYVTAWGCSGPTLEGMDCVTIDCRRPETEFDKKVQFGKTWVDEINTTVGATLRFKLSVTYYGEEEYDILKFKDLLPCILKYADNAEAYVDDGERIPIEGELQSDNKTVWFNFTDDENFTLSDGVKISVEFDALVTGQTDCGCDCDIDALNKAWFYIYERIQCDLVLVEEFYDELLIHSEGNCVPYPLGIEGPSEGTPDEELTFRAAANDTDGDRVRFEIDWDDGTSTGWMGPYDSEFWVTIKHTFSTEGTYQLRIRAKDEYLTSKWVVALKVKIADPPVSELQISIPKKLLHIKNIAAQIKNVGEISVSDIDWTFDISKSGVILKWNITNSGTIEELGIGETKAIESGAVTLKVGRATIEIKATSDEASATLTENAFVLGRLIFVL
jgi:fimbrial isopeptide formation D2 family protein